MSPTPLHPKPLTQGRIEPYFHIVYIKSEWCSWNPDSDQVAFFLFFFQYYTLQFWWASIKCSFILLLLADRSGTWHLVFCCCSPSASRFDVLCFQRRCHLGCNKWLLELLLPSYHTEPVCPFSSTPWHRFHSVCRPHICRPLDTFSFSDRSLHTAEVVVHENPSRSAVCETLQQPCHIQSHLNPLSFPICSELQHQPACLGRCHVIGCLAVYVNKQLNRCVQ